MNMGTLQAKFKAVGANIVRHASRITYMAHHVTVPSAHQIKVDLHLTKDALAFLQDGPIKHANVLFL